MFKRFSTLALSTAAAATIAVGAVPRPASADAQSTINTLLGAAAVVGGIVISNNIRHKQQANQVVGYTQNGGTVYGDGRIVAANGQTYYPNANGQYAWGQPAYYNPNANYYANGYNGIRRDNGHDRGWNNHQDGSDENRGKHREHGDHGDGEHGDHH